MALIGDRKDHAARSNGWLDLGGASRRDGGSYVHGREEINRFSGTVRGAVITIESVAVLSPPSRLLMRYLGVASTDWQQR